MYRKTVHISFPYRDDETLGISVRRLSSEEVVTDFITELLALLPSSRLYSHATPGAKDSCVENHGDLYNSAAQTGDKPLLSRFVDRRQAMPQCEIELFHEARDE